MLRRLAFLALGCAALGGCANTERFAGIGQGSMPPTGSQRMDDTFGPGRAAARPQGQENDIIPGGMPAPGGRDIATTELAPVGPVGTIPPADPAAGRAPITPQATATAGLGTPAIPTEPAEPALPRVAALPRASDAPRSESPRVTAPAAASVAGTWTVSDAGDRCRITLTTSPLFEFYRANPQNCRARSLARINAWEQRGSEIVLLQPGGQVVARLAPQGGNYAGATASGAPVTMTR